MHEKVLFLASPLKKKMYGGQRIQKQFGFTEYIDEKIGEYWAISAHPNGTSMIKGGTLDGVSLSEVWDTHRELFGNSLEERFPLLIKINEITSPVSVQVHPDDDYAKKNANDLGKAEFCLFLDVEKGTKVIRGHVANTKEDFIEMVDANAWDDLFIKKEVQTNDYVFTPPGVIHGVEGKMLMAEVQQSSDVTYRLYDYDNVDEFGNSRELHMHQAIETSLIPHQEPTYKTTIEHRKEATITKYIDNQFFEIVKYEVHQQCCIDNPSYSLCLVLLGSGKLVIDDEIQDIKAGSSFIITSNTTRYSFVGEVSVLVTKPPKG